MHNVFSRRNNNKGHKNDSVQTKDEDAKVTNMSELSREELS